ncbi:telomere-associated protein Tap [Streptomyces sp. NPDC003860]
MTAPTLVPRQAGGADRASYDRVFTALEQAGCTPRARGDAGLDACCPVPAHGDTSASLSGDWKPPTADKAGRTLLNCHVGCAYDDILIALGLTRADLFDGPSPAYADRRTSTPSPRRPGPPSPRQATPKPQAKKEPKADHKCQFQDEVTHTYDDDADVVHARIHRKRCAVEGCGKKTFRTAYPGGKKPADGLPLYGTRGLAAAIAAGRTIHVVEGEGDRDALTAAGEIAVSAPFGADKGTGEKWLPRYTEQLRGARSVVVWADRDQAGLTHAGYVANQLAADAAEHAQPSETGGHGVALDLRIVYPAVTRPKADASDHLTAGHAVADAVTVPSADLASTGLEGLATTPPRKPTPTPSDAPPTHPPSDEETPADAPPPGSPVEGSSGWRYSTTAGRHGAFWKASGQGKNRTWEQVLGWAPIAGERLIKINEDGSPGAKYFVLTVGEDTKTMSIKDLRTGEAWDEMPDAVGTGTKQVREALLNCVETQARELPRTPVVTHTGWYDLPDVGRTYVFADGRTYPEGRPIRVLDVPEALRRAAEPLGETCDTGACGQAVQDILAHGWVGALSLAVGARSLAYSLRPVPASLLLDAEPNSGKTSGGNVGRSLLYTPRPAPWPPVVTKGFNSTITDIECAVDLEGDSPLLLDDVALTRASSAMEVRDMERKLELILRAAGNATEIRGRRNRDLSAKPGNRVRSIPVIAAQMLPPSMQESLYRRSVVAYLSQEGGEVDWRWYRDGGGAALAVPLRTIGERIIAHLHGLEDPSGYLADLEEEALKAFRPYAEAALPDASGAMDGVVTAAAGMLAGFGLVAAVTGLAMRDLLDVVMEPLAASIAQQARKMDDQSVLQDDLGTAVVDVVRAALSTGRAHIRDAQGTIRPAVPGEVEQVQGVTPNRDGAWEGKGPAFYWMPAADPGPSVGVKTAALHGLLAASSDPRVKGIGQRSLPAALLQAELTYPSKQTGRKAVHQVRIGTDNPRVLLIRADRMWGDLDDPSGEPAPPSDPPSPPGDSSAPEHPDDEHRDEGLFGVDAAAATDSADQESTTTKEDDDMGAHVNQLPTAPCVRCGNPTSHWQDGQPVHKELPGLYRCDSGYTTPDLAHLNPSTQAAAPAQPPARTPSPRPAQSSTPSSAAQADDPTTTTFPAGPVAVVDVDDHGKVLAHLGDGRTLDVPARSLKTLVPWALETGLGQERLHKWGSDADPVVVLTPAATKRFGLPAELEDRRSLRLPDTHKVVKDLTKAGWTLTKRGFGPWARVYQPVKNGIRRCVQIGVVPWGALDRASGWHMDTDTAPEHIARVLGTYAQRVIAPRGTMASSGIELMTQLRPPTRPVKVEQVDEATGEVVSERFVSGPVEGSLCEPRRPAPCEAPVEHPIVHELFGRHRPEDEAMHEEAWDWHRDVSPEETRYASCVGIDTNTSFLAGSSRLLVGDSDPEHVIRPAFDPKVPGAWKADLSHAYDELESRRGTDEVNPLDPRFPNPFTRTGQPPTGPAWYTTQTLTYARRLGVTVTPIEAHLRTALAAGWLDPWNERLATAYKVTMGRLGVQEGMPPEQFLEAMARYEAGEGDPVERAVLAAIKQTVKNGIGKLRSTPNRYVGYQDGQPWADIERPWWRPDIRFAIIATARVVQHSKIMRTYQLTGRAPLATYSDAVVYATDTRTPLEVIPRDEQGQQMRGAFRLGVAPGWVKLEGARSLDWYTEAHKAGENPARFVAPREGEHVDEGE